MESITSLARPFLLAIAASFILVGASQAQVAEEEPNDPCLAAQYIGPVTLPFSLAGELETNDVDFFRFDSVPDVRLVAALQGLSSAQGTLSDPFLGLFDSQCNLITYNDDSSSLDSRLEFNVPADGVFILAATACCDWTFTGDHFNSGTYTMVVDEALEPGRIEGRVVDESSGLPLPGDTLPYAFADLYYCYDSDCWSYSWINWQYTDSDGRFSFASDSLGNSLISGTYQVYAGASGYTPMYSAPFEFVEGEVLDVGDVALSPLSTGGSIAGQVVDSLTLLPLPGGIAPYAYVSLYSCFDNLCDYSLWINGQSADLEGRFLFDSDYMGAALLTGFYQVSASALEYAPQTSEVFALGEGEHLDIGLLALDPPPVAFSDIVPCAYLPSEGGTCDYSVRITNNMSTPLQGGAWSLVSAYGTGSYLDSTDFQAGQPRRMQLDPGDNSVVRFRFDVPSDVRDGAWICARVLVGGDLRSPYFDTLGTESLFCMTKGGYTGYKVVSKEQAKAILQRQQVLGGAPPRGPHRP